MSFAQSHSGSTTEAGLRQFSSDQTANHPAFQVLNIPYAFRDFSSREFSHVVELPVQFLDIYLLQGIQQQHCSSLDSDGKVVSSLQTVLTCSHLVGEKAQSVDAKENNQSFYKI